MLGPATSDFAPLVGRARAAQAEAWIAFGGAREAGEMAKSFRKLDYAPKLFFASGAADPKFIQLVGQDAEGALGASAYEPAFASTGNQRFAPAYTARWNAEPDLPAAQGYAAGQLLAQAVRRAGSVEPEALRQAMKGLAPATVLSNPPAVLQIQHGKRVPVWPAALAGARLAPYVAWGERKLLK